MASQFIAFDKGERGNMLKKKKIFKDINLSGSCTNEVLRGVQSDRNPIIAGNIR